MQAHALANALLVTAVTLLSTSPSLAQSPGGDYPSRTVTLINPFVPGTITEADARPMLQYLTENLGKPFVMDFKPGAGGTLGTHFVAKAAPDAHTLLIASAGFTTNFALRDNLPYARKDFAPVSLLSQRGVFLVVTPSLQVHNFAEYLAYVRANPGKLNWGTSGAGSTFHMAGAYLASVTNTKVTFIHYKGNALNFIDLIAGRVQVSPMTSFAAMSFVKSGKVRPIAHLSASRSRVMPDLPAVAELGVPGYDYSSWGAVLTTGGSPPAAINKLAAAIGAYTRNPEASARAIREGYELISSTPAALGELIDAEMVRWKKVVADNNIKFEDE